MGVWTFVLEEIDPNEHGKRHKRRKIAWWRASLFIPPITKVTDSDGEGDVGESTHAGKGRYNWTVNDPTDFYIHTWLGIILSFNNVTLVSGPTRLFSREEASNMQNLFDTIRNRNDSGIE
jgi:hypothetical protein